MTGEQTLSEPSHERAHAGWGSASLTTAAATTVVYTPSLLFRPDLWDNMSGYVVLAWFVVSVLAAPVTAALVDRHRPVATTQARSWLLGLPQLPLVVGLMWIDIWLDIRSGYLIAESGEVEMVLGFGTVMATGVGLLLTVLVYAAARIGAPKHRS